MLTKWLIRRFVRHPENTADPDVRCAYGRFAGVVGVVANVLLFAGKVTVGLLGSSLAVVADAFNNLSDAGSSVVTLVGFKLASAPPDEEHPFGHGRVEYLSALTVAALIMIAGFELLKSAVDKIIHPVESAHSWVTVALLIAAIGVKLWLSLFNRRIGGRIASQALLATAADSRNDVICTAVVLLSYLADFFWGIQIDGYVGAAVALFVMWSGFSVMRDTVSPLLGEAPDPELVERIRETVLSRDGIVGIHDLIIHNYGPGRCLVSLHAEVPAHKDILHSHELVDDIEQQLIREHHIVACIHMDPVDTLDERVGTLKVLSETILGDIDERLTLHDFRVVFGENRINVIFDVTVPFGYTGNATLQAEVQRRLQLTDPRLYAVITLEHSYV
ncbi:MAG: cation transporter [Clostridia bacterium]|nr:cation transporter [Clostridia bacterium]